MSDTHTGKKIRTGTTALPTLPERCYRLSNGRFATHLTPEGGGHLLSQGCWLTSSRDSLGDGVFFYVRDTQTEGVFWSATLHPTLAAPDRYEIREYPSAVEFVRENHRIETRLMVGVPMDGQWELRRLTLTNRDRYPRVLEVTSAIDITLLYDRLRDIDHQTFSNLFVGSRFVEGSRALLFHRRAFSQPENFPVFSHHVIPGETAEFVGFETARETFLGRGHGFEWPASLFGNPSGTVGYTLDPIASLRYRVTLAPGASATFWAVQAAHFPPAVPEHFLETFSHPGTVSRLAADIFTATQATETFSFSHEDLGDCFPDPQSPKKQAAGRSGQKEPSLRFWNGIGGFGPEDADYHIRFDPKTGLPPQPWSNILCNPHFGMTVTENALGGTWHQDSRNDRLTPWSNDPVVDPPVEILYLKDRSTGAVFSATPAPFLDSPYDIVHARGYTTYQGCHGSVRHHLTAFTDRKLPVKHLLLELENIGDRPLTLSVAHFLDYPANGASDETVAPPRCDHRHHALCLPTTMSGPEDPGPSIAVFSSEPIHRYATSKRHFFGPARSLLYPRQLAMDAVADGDGQALPGRDACAVFQTSDFVLAPGERRTLSFSLTSTTSHRELETVLDGFPAEDISTRITQALQATTDFWKNTLDTVRVATPDPSLDVLFDGWLPYQILSSRLWGRTAFYQSSGAFGYRDQLQDVVALLHIDPDIARAHILHCACEQYEDGNTRWWWFPEDNRGVRSHSSDNPLWLAWAAAEYVRFTGDTSIWDATVPYLKSVQDDDIAPGLTTDYHESLWQHCYRAIEYVLHFGPHGLPLIRRGDWNDGMNLVGREGRGESVWLGFFLAHILSEYLAILETRAADRTDGEEHRTLDSLRRFRYQSILSDLKENLERHAWDGRWYSRAFYDDGTPLGSHKNRDGRIDSISQSWSVLSEAVSGSRAAQAMKSLWKHLYDPKSRTLRLIDPPFDRDPRTPGYIKDYPPGIRENGSQYNHAALWAAQAFAAQGDAERAWDALQTANPAARSGTATDIARYQTEPYAVAADIYTAPEFLGMGGWTWYTASAGLFYRTVIEWIFGLRREGDRIVVRPCLPHDWHDASIEIGYRSSRYLFRFRAEKRHRNVPVSMTCDHLPAAPVSGHPTVTLHDDGRRHEVEIRLT